MTSAQIKRFLKKTVSWYYRKNLENKNFSIISNNCWGGQVYDRYGLPYLTPTIGLWIPPSDYVRLCTNLEEHVSKNLVQISYRDCNVRNLLEKRKENGSYKFDLNTLVIGRIDDSIDIIFFHYNNFEEARDKWNRRKRRINYDNLLVKFCDQNECTREDFINFEKLDYNNKIFFTAKKDLISPSSVYVPGFEKKGYVEDTKLSNLPLDITELLNSMKKL